MIQQIHRYWNGCTNCNCDGSSSKPLCTSRGCPFSQIVPNYCIECAAGYQMLNGICVPECGGMPYCSRYIIYIHATFIISKTNIREYVPK